MFIRFSKKQKNSQQMLNSLPDQALINRYLHEGCNESIGELYIRYTHLVFGVCMKYLKNEEDSKDAVMQIFENLFSDLKNHEIRNFKSWLHSVSRNYCLMQLRKNKSSPKTIQGLQTDEIFMESEELLHPHNEINNKEINLHKAIKSLKPEQRRCIELVYLQDKSYIEAAQNTGYTVKQVKSYVQNGKRNLKIKLEQLNEPGEENITSN